MADTNATVQTTHRGCAVVGCGKRHFGRGYCSPHYQRWLKYGDAEHPGVRDNRTWLEKFESRFTRAENEDACWLWDGPCHEFGYGMVSDPSNGKRTLGAHRVAYELYVGQIPAGQWVLHRCDTPRCVRPSHLFLGDCADNVEDMVSKDRNTRLEWHPKAKLTIEQVRSIRARYTRRGTGSETIPKLAREFGVSTSTMGNIVRGVTWKGI